MYIIYIYIYIPAGVYNGLHAASEVHAQLFTAAPGNVWRP